MSNDQKRTVEQQRQRDHLDDEDAPGAAHRLDDVIVEPGFVEPADAGQRTLAQARTSGSAAGIAAVPLAHWQRALPAR
jgi:hypothetical protein